VCRPETAVPTLNRFPLLGLWAREAARRIGYSTPDAEALGHAYALLYAIRANMKPEPSKAAEPRARPRRRRGLDELSFGGDTLDVVYDDAGHVQGAVGGGRPQTPRSYRTSVANKFPPGYLAAVSTAFRRVLRAYPPRTLDSKLVYDVYDQWKKACAVGRRVDLDRLIEWCHARASGTAPKLQATAPRTAARRSSKSRASSRAAPPTSLLK
jgi:hypothetical protein